MYKKWLTLGACALALTARAEKPVQDDPRGRAEAMRLLEGVRTPEQRLAILRDAEREAARYGLRGSRFTQAATAVPGTAWINLGPTSADYEFNGLVYNKVDSGRARKILVDPRDPNVLYFATSGGGVWKTYDALAAGGPHWQPITEGIGSLSIGSIAMNPLNPDSLVLGLGDPFGVQVPGMLHSDDAGATWSTAVALTGTYDNVWAYTATSVLDVQFDPGGAIVLAATNAGVFRSAEGGLGSGWHLVRPDNTTAPVQCWSIAYAGPHTWLLTCDDGNNGSGKVYRSTDDGVSFGSVAFPGTTLVKRMTVATPSVALPGGGWRAYLLAANADESDQQDVYTSDDAGASWTSLSMVPRGRPPRNPAAKGTDIDQDDLDFLHGQAFYNHMIVVDPTNPNAVFIGGNLCMGRSTDGGTTWDLLTDWLPFAGRFTGFDMDQYAHADWHAGTIVHSGGKAYFYGGNDGGLIRNIDQFVAAPPSTMVWEDGINKGIVSHLIYSVATGLERAPTGNCPTAAGVTDMVLGGFQDNGTRLRVLPASGTPAVFNQIAGGDGFGVGIGCNLTNGGVGSNLISTYASLIRYTDDGFAAMPVFTESVKSDGTGLNPKIVLDPYYTFVMRIAADTQAAAGRTYITPLTDNTGTATTPPAGHVYRSTDGGQTWNGINGTIHRAAGTTATKFPLPLRNAATHPKAADLYGAVGYYNVYVTADAGANWYESPLIYSSTVTNGLSVITMAFDPADLTGKTVWVGSRATSMSDYNAIPAGIGHLFRCTGIGVGSTGVCAHAGGGIPENAPVNVVKVDPNDRNVVYVGTEIGLYRSTNGTAATPTFTRYGKGLPLVSVTDISVAWDGSAIRIATYGRGFWEIHPKPGGSVAGVAGTGDFDFSQTIEGCDLVREAAALLTDSSRDDYDALGNLVGGTNSIDANDWNALVAKLGGRP